jgi:hypothetical protein
MKWCLVNKATHKLERLLTNFVSHNAAFKVAKEMGLMADYYIIHNPIVLNGRVI